MSAPTVTLCKCGHAEHRHSEDEGCGRSECGCAAFRFGRIETVPPAPVVAPAPRPVAALARPAGGPTIDQLIAAGLRSDVKRTTVLAGKIRELAKDLHTRLIAEQAAAERKRSEQAAKEAARQRVADLERQLAEERAKLRAGRAPADAIPCTEQGCTATLMKQNMPRHVRQMHGRNITGERACTHEGCGRTFPTGQGLAMHERRAHDGFDPRASKAVAS